MNQFIPISNYFGEWSLHNSHPQSECFLIQGSTVDPGPSPPNYLDQQLSLQTAVIYDTVPFFKSFGDVTTDVRTSYRPVGILDRIAKLIRMP